jgi:branched-subunit amino acid ABC-type transport system permease component
VDLGIRSFPAYRLVIIALGLSLFLGLWLVVERTSFGARLRAAVDNRKIAQSIGIRTDHLFTLTFALGSGLAALGGALGAEFLPIRPAYAAEQLNNVLIVVAVGGLGTLQGPFWRLFCSASVTRPRGTSLQNSGYSSSMLSSSCYFFGARMGSMDGLDENRSKHSHRPRGRECSAGGSSRA